MRFSRLGDALIVIDVNFFLFEGVDEFFSHIRSPKAVRAGDGNLNAMFLERGNISI